MLSSRSGLKSRGWSHRAWAPGRSCPAFHWRVHCRRYKCGHPLQGQCPKLVHRADTRAHPCTCTQRACAHTHTELAQQPVELSLPPCLPSTASKAEIKGTAVQSHPTQSALVSPSWDIENHRFVGMGKATFYSSRYPPALAGGLALQSRDMPPQETEQIILRGDGCTTTPSHGGCPGCQLTLLG